MLAEDAFLLASPGGPRDRQLLHGERFDVLDVAEGHAFGMSAKDGYVGHVALAALGPAPEPTHAVAARRAHLYPEPDLKRPPVAALSFGARLAADPSGRWAETAWRGARAFVPAMHLRPIDAPMEDPAGVAERLLGAPYLWAGNGADGLDCSGLVQAALLACGIDCPGDSDQQEARVGTPLPEGAALRRGRPDLLGGPCGDRARRRADRPRQRARHGGGDRGDHAGRGADRGAGRRTADRAAAALSAPD